MYFFLIKMTILISLLIFFLKNPMSMGILLLIQTLSIIMIMNKSMNFSWFSMTTFLMMMGGLLILFMYMSSIASNEKFKFKINLSMMLVLMMLMNEQMMIEFQINEEEKINQKMNMEMSMMKMYNQKSMTINMIMVMYLLITMISSSFLVKYQEGPLRNKNN